MSISQNLLTVLKFSGGKMVGRMRLQKTVFLLQAAGAETDVSFEYHHYGPYSSELSSAIFWAESEGKIQETFDYRQSDGARYSVFHLIDDDIEADSFGDLPADRAFALLSNFKAESSITLELAATAYWLKNCEGVEDWRTEIRVRKARKATDERLNMAVSLLEKCHIPL